MNYSNYRVTLDIRKTVASVQLNAKRGDTGRKLYITLSDHGVPCKIADGCYAVFAGTKPDGTLLYNKTTVEDNTIIYAMTQQTTAVAGLVACEVKLFDSMSNLLTSPKLTILVDDVVVPDEEIVSKDEVTALVELVTEATATIELGNQTIEAGNAATDAANTATQNANEATKNADNAAAAANAGASAANTAANSANANAASASEAASSANAAAGVANKAASDANASSGVASAAAENANTATARANEAAVNAETATSNAETATTNANQATQNANNAANNANAEAGKATQAAENANAATTNANTAASEARAATAETNTAREAIVQEAGDILASLSDAVYATPIECNVTGDVITVSDASNQQLAGLSVYGKTTQNGTPTPEAPIPLVSAGENGSISVTVAGKNLLDFEACLKTWRSSYVREGEKYTLNTFGVGYSQPIRLFEEVKAVSVRGIITDVTASLARIDFGIIGSDGNFTTVRTLEAAHDSCNDISINAMRLNYSSNGTCTMENIQMELGTSVTQYEPYKGQTATFSTGDGLRGVDGVCDEIDLARGVRVQRFCEVDLGSLDWTYRSAEALFNSAPLTPKPVAHAKGLCTHYKVVAKLYRVLEDKETVIYESGFSRNEYVLVKDSSYTDGATFKAAMSGVKLIYELAQPIETPLSAQELASFAALHSNKPNTTAFNDGGAGLGIAYNADTKLYIDNKINELATAILNNA